MFVVKGTKGKGIVSVAAQTAASALVTATGIQSSSFSVTILDDDGHEISMDQLSTLATVEGSAGESVPSRAPV